MLNYQRKEAGNQKTGSRALKWECGLRPIGAIEAYAPEGSRKKAKSMEIGNKLNKKSVF